MLFLIRDVMRTAHVLAAAAWVGGMLVYLLVIVPALRLGKSSPEVGATIAARFRELTSICIWTLLVSGVFLMYDRLTAADAGVPYIVTLVVKVVISLAMFALAIYQAQEARRPRSRRGRLWGVTPRLLLALGIAVFALGVTLTWIYEATLRAF